MRKPTCSLCQGKVKDNSFLWLPEEKKLVHILCRKLNKDVVLRLGPIKIGVQERM